MPMQVKYSTMLDARKVKQLREWSSQTKVPQAKLLEEAIDLLGASLAHDVVTPAYRRVVDQVIKEDLPALKRLAK
ncbi:MAG: ribbon-helix-helix domain-containing protein [Candidatus Omnitrophica bacterium]|nr:ribbon-helix-helix domain-containing protein [Candidatus Omnitrophota bacterium]